MIYKLVLPGKKEKFLLIHLLNLFQVFNKFEELRTKLFSTLDLNLLFSVGNFLLSRYSDMVVYLFCNGLWWLIKFMFDRYQFCLLHCFTMSIVIVFLKSNSNIFIWLDRIYLQSAEKFKWLFLFVYTLESIFGSIARVRKINLFRTFHISFILFLKILFISFILKIIYSVNNKVVQ